MHRSVDSTRYNVPGTRQPTDRPIILYNIYMCIYIIYTNNDIYIPWISNEVSIDVKDSRAYLDRVESWSPPDTELAIFKATVNEITAGSWRVKASSRRTT